MRVDAFLIQQPSVAFGPFLSLTREAMGYSVVAKCDSSGRQLNDAERFVSCLEALRDPNAIPALWPHLLNHVSFSVAMIADDRDMIEILELASGMHFVRAETRARGIDLAVITGTLAQWRDAAKNGTQQGGVVQVAFCKVIDLFVQVGLNVWKDFNWKPDSVNKGLFLIEDKRG